MSCKAEGNPLPTVQWYKDGVCIDNNPQYQITYNNGEALLKIEHTNTFHNGKYTCVATNRLGSDSTASKLFVDGEYLVLYRNIQNIIKHSSVPRNESFGRQPPFGVR